MENIINSVKYLFWIGVRLQQAVTFPSFIEAQRTDILKESKQIHGSRNPTPMMAVLHMLPQVVQKYVEIINKRLSDEPNRHLEIALQASVLPFLFLGHAREFGLWLTRFLSAPRMVRALSRSWAIPSLSTRCPCS